MIARIRRWRKSKQQQCVEERLRTSQQLGLDTGPEEPVQIAGSLVGSGQTDLFQDSASGSVLEPKETRQLQEKLSRGAYRQARMNPTAEDWAIWRGRLRPRTDTVGALHDRTKTINTQAGKPQGIAKRRKAPKKNRLPATKRQATTSITKADPAHLSEPQSRFNESSPQAIPGSVAKARGTKNQRRQSPPNQCGATARCTKGP